MHQKKRRGRWRKWALLFFLAVFVLSGGALLRIQYRAHHEQAANKALAEQIHAASEAAEQPDADPAASRQQALRALWEQNNDFAGWLSIDGTEIDYPVMYTPDAPEYYLRRGFDKADADSGSLFIGAGCAPDGSNVIIYGHNMRNGSMFGTLSAYEDPAYRDAHPVIRFDTLQGGGEYEVIAAFYSRVYHVDEADGFRYYQYTDLTDPERFQEYLNQIRAVSLYDTAPAAAYGTRLLTLSTCSYHREDGRFVVVAAQTQ